MANNYVGLVESSGAQLDAASRADKRVIRIEHRLLECDQVGVGPGANAYVLKELMRGSEPIHWICANCFQDGKKRFLSENHSDLHHVYHKCHECSYKIRIRKSPSVLGQTIAVTDIELFVS